MEGTLMTISEEIEQEKTPKKALPPVIFETVEYERRRVQCNPGVGRIPHDVLRFDPTELERPLREILYSGDNCAQKPAFGGKKWEIAHVRGLGEDEIAAFIPPKGLDGNRAAFLREHMLADQGSLDNRFRKADQILEDEGPSYMSKQLSYVKEAVERIGQCKASGEKVSSR